jgi:dTDP-4-amino-4,6-dideoxygalactose transaminase
MHAVLSALVDEKIGPGELSAQLAQAAKEKLGFHHCLTLRSPAYALQLSLQLLDLRPGDAVLVSALSPEYYSRVLADLGLRSVIADVTQASPTLDAASIEAAMSVAAVPVKAIVLHHCLGFLADVASVLALGVHVIEDMSAGVGSGFAAADEAGSVAAAAEAGSAPGGGGGVGCESGGASAAQNAAHGVFTILGLEEHDMITAGGGALLYAQNKRDAALLANRGKLPPEYALPDMNAALAAVQLKELSRSLSRRGEIAGIYSQAALKGRHGIFVRDEGPSGGGGGIAYNNYAFPLILETGMRDVKAYAAKKGVDVELAFGNTLAGSGIVEPEKCPIAYGLSLRTALFPIYPRLGAKDAETVARVISTIP